MERVLVLGLRFSLQKQHRPNVFLLAFSTAKKAEKSVFFSAVPDTKGQLPYFLLLLLAVAVFFSHCFTVNNQQMQLKKCLPHRPKALSKNFTSAKNTDDAEIKNIKKHFNYKYRYKYNT